MVLMDSFVWTVLWIQRHLARLPQRRLGAASEMVRVKKPPRGDEVGCADSSHDVSMAEAAFFDG